jgi:uncharacterized LabA/DUF88 family protein
LKNKKDLKTKKTAGVYIDGANILHGSKKAGWKVDYKKLKNYLEGMYKVKNISFYDSIGYERSKEGGFLYDKKGLLKINNAQDNFHNFLKGEGYRTVIKKLKFINNDFSKPKNNMDTYLTIDVLQELDQWDNLVLFSGDCDFDRLVETVMNKGKNIAIYSFKSRLSYELRTKGINFPAVTFHIIDNLQKELEYKK